MRLPVPALALSLVFAAGPAAHADVYLVNSTADASDAFINGVCATAGGSCTLRAAIQEANAVTNPDTIQLPAGTYTLAMAGADSGALAGDLDILNAVEIVGAGASVTIIDAASIDRVFEIPFAVGTFAVSIDSVTIRGGRKVNEGGAGILHSDDGTLALSSVTITDNHVIGGTSSSVGGAIDVNGGGTVTLQGCLLSENSADRGGAIFTNSTFTLVESTLTDGVARVGSAVESYGTTTIERSTIWGNEATGGATVDVGSGQLILRNSTLSGNTGTSAVATVIAGLLAFDRSTISDNRSNGSIFAAGGVVEAIGSVIARSSGAECVAGAGVFATLESNLDDDGSCVPSGTSITAASPKLGPLADNGGPTRTRAPRPGSPLIDAAEPAPICTGVDQRNLPRPAEGGGTPESRCDIGAVELAPEPASVVLGVAALVALAARRRRRS